MSVIYKILLTLCSLLLTMTVYLVKENVFILNFIGHYIDDSELKIALLNIPKYVSCIVYFAFAILLTLLSLHLSRFLSEDRVHVGSIVNVEAANDAFLPSYLGYFFVALSVSSTVTFIYVFSMIFIFIYFSKISYFNPIFLLLGYKFFYLTDTSGLKVVVITKKELKTPKEVYFDSLKRINNYTFITMEK